MFKSFLICLLEVGPGGEGSREHEDGGAGSVKVGEEVVDNLKFEAGVDEDVGLTGEIVDRGSWIVENIGVSLGDVLESAGDGGANGKDAVVGGFGLCDCLDSGGGDVKPFGVHVMGFDVVFADRLESAQADVEGKINDFDAFGLDLVNELLGDVERGSGGGDRAFLGGEDGLVTNGVFWSGGAFDIWGQGNLAGGLG